MNDVVYNALFLCTGNSARSILAEALLNHMGGGRFRGFSAGSFPVGRVHPLALRVLAEQGVPVADPRSKSWDEFAGADAPPLDFVFTVCDSAAGETCPVWPGGPATAHWGIPDPAAVEGDEATRLAAFRAAYRRLARRIGAFTQLPIESLDPIRLQQRLQQIGTTSS